MGDGLPAAGKAPSVLPTSVVKQRERAATAVGAPIVPPPLTSTTTATSSGPKRKPAPITAVTTASPSVGRYSIKNWLLQRFSRDSLIGFGASLTMHLMVLGTMAFILIAHTVPRESINLFGMVGESDDVGSDLLIDTGTSLDSGSAIDPGEATELPMTDVSQSLATLGSGNEIPETIRFGGGGSGSGGEGDGSGGEGVKMGTPGLKIPGHAQTKGSFSAWTDPADPKPKEDYVIVIQIRVPKSVTKFRGSDISGQVLGTDTYRKNIHYRSTDQFPVKDGVVELRIDIPGGDARVRDTIRIESKTLREKQTFEIEF